MGGNLGVGLVVAIVAVLCGVAAALFQDVGDHHPINGRARHGRERVAAVCERTLGPAIDCRAPSAHDVEAREPLQYVKGEWEKGNARRKIYNETIVAEVSASVQDARLAQQEAGPNGIGTEHRWEGA